MPYCECGNHVSQRYWRVFSAEGSLDQCYQCGSAVANVTGFL